MIPHAEAPIEQEQVQAEELLECGACGGFFLDNNVSEFIFDCGKCKTWRCDSCVLEMKPGEQSNDKKAVFQRLKDQCGHGKTNALPSAASDVATPACRRQLCQPQDQVSAITAVARPSWDKDLGKEIWDMVIHCLALSPGAHDNGVACASRILNVRWRSYHRPIYRAIVDNAKKVSFDCHRQVANAGLQKVAGGFGNIYLLLCDLEDVTP